MDQVLLAVNGGLMRGMDSHGVMLDAGARFVREDSTEPAYRLWSIEDRFPAMLRVGAGGVSIAVEIYELPPDGFVAVLQRETSISTRPDSGRTVPERIGRAAWMALPLGGTRSTSTK